MSRLGWIVGSCLLLTFAVSAHAAEIGRYSITIGEAAKIGRTIILLDTATGRTWELSEVSKPLKGAPTARLIDKRWVPLRYQKRAGEIDRNDPIIPDAAVE